MIEFQYEFKFFHKMSYLWPELDLRVFKIAVVLTRQEKEKNLAVDSDDHDKSPITMVTSKYLRYLLFKSQSYRTNELFIPYCICKGHNYQW